MNRCPRNNAASILLGATLLLSSGQAFADETTKPVTPLETRSILMIHAVPAPLLDLSVPPEAMNKLVDPPCNGQRSTAAVGMAPHEQALGLVPTLVELDEHLTGSRVRDKNGNATFDDELTELVRAAIKLKNRFKDDIRIYGLSKNHRIQWDVQPDSGGTVSINYTGKFH